VIAIKGGTVIGIFTTVLIRELRHRNIEFAITRMIKGLIEEDAKTQKVRQG
jgi:hypothetical protein